MPPPNAARVMRVARVVAHGRQILICPDLDEDSSTAFDPFPFLLPQVLLSQSLCACEQLWARHGRCMAFGVMVDTTSRRFGLHLPSQRCAADAASWNFLEENPSPPGVRLVGTLQSRKLASFEQAIEAPPPMSGIHFVIVLSEPNRELWAFHRPPEAPEPKEPGAPGVPGDFLRPIAGDDVIEFHPHFDLDSLLPRLTLV